MPAPVASLFRPSVTPLQQKIMRLLDKAKPDEIYHHKELAGLVDAHVSTLSTMAARMPEYTIQVTYNKRVWGSKAAIKAAYKQQEGEI
jgi:hypothetical protein